MVGFFYFGGTFSVFVFFQVYVSVFLVFEFLTLLLFSSFLLNCASFFHLITVVLTKKVSFWSRSRRSFCCCFGPLFVVLTRICSPFISILVVFLLTFRALFLRFASFLPTFPSMFSFFAQKQLFLLNLSEDHQILEKCVRH